MRLTKQAQKDLILGNVVTAMTMLQSSRAFSFLMPEVRVNLVYALPDARTEKDVAAIDGRITVVNGLPRASGLPAWGGSDHMARLVIQVRRHDPSVNAGINFKCDADVIEIVKQYCQQKGFRFGFIDRSKEPSEVAGPERSSMPWKIDYMVQTYGGVPKLFYENEGWGKEPLFVVLGKDAVEVARIALEIAQRYRKKIKAS
jgi:predicted fused transcriptional regulator/phosphomethylpyrimidine kinase